MPAQRKIDIVAKLSEKLSRAKALVFTNYQGLTHKQLEGLKRALKSVNAELVVTKNTLLKRALETNKELGIRNKEETKSHDSKFMIPDSSFEGPTATLFSYSDVLAPLKEIARTIRLFNLPIIKFGILEGKLVEAEDLIRLSTLPSREVLLSQLTGAMKTPIYGLHRALNWNMQKLVLTLKSIENSKK